MFGADDNVSSNENNDQSRIKRVPDIPKDLNKNKISKAGAHKNEKTNNKSINKPDDFKDSWGNQKHKRVNNDNKQNDYISLVLKDQRETKKVLNTFIHDFLAKSDMKETAEVFKKENKSNMLEPFDTPSNSEEEKILEAFKIQRSFLNEWWQIFWDVFNAKAHKNGSKIAQEYYSFNIGRQNLDFLCRQASMKAAFEQQVFERRGDYQMEAMQNHSSMPNMGFSNQSVDPILTRPSTGNKQQMQSQQNSNFLYQTNHSMPQASNHSMPQASNHSMPQAPNHSMPQAPNHSMQQVSNNDMAQSSNSSMPHSSTNNMQHLSKSGMPSVQGSLMPQMMAQNMPQMLSQNMPQFANTNVNSSGSFSPPKNKSSLVQLAQEMSSQQMEQVQKQQIQKIQQQQMQHIQQLQQQKQSQQQQQQQHQRLQLTQQQQQQHAQQQMPQSQNSYQMNHVNDVKSSMVGAKPGNVSNQKMVQQLLAKVSPMVTPDYNNIGSANHQNNNQQLNLGNNNQSFTSHQAHSMPNMNSYNDQLTSMSNDIAQSHEGSRGQNMYNFMNSNGNHDESSL
ncbi:hypothetical protein QEN19_003409 [Hanseniaspora menglaensis]